MTNFQGAYHAYKATTAIPEVKADSSAFPVYFAIKLRDHGHEDWFQSIIEVAHIAKAGRVMGAVTWSTLALGTLDWLISRKGK